MSSEVKTILVTIGAITAVVITILSVIIYLGFVYQKYIQCPAFASQVERPYRYDWFAGGCFVQTREGQWVAEKNYWNSPVFREDLK